MSRLTTARREIIEWWTPTATESAYRLWWRWTSVVLVLYLLVRAPVLMSSGVGSFAGVGILAPVSAPLPDPLLVAIWATAVASTAGTAIGIRPTSTVPVMAVSVLTLLTHRSSLGQILWFDTLPVAHVLILAVATACIARTQAVGPALSRVSAAMVRGWAIRLAAVATVVTYVVSAITKLRVSGLAWIGDDALANHISYTATRARAYGAPASPLAERIPSGGFGTLFAVCALAIELGAPIALMGRRYAFAWAAATWTMHSVIALAMFTIFHWPLSGAAFVPLLLTMSKGSTRPDST